MMRTIFLIAIGASCTGCVTAPEWNYQMLQSDKFELIEPLTLQNEFGTGSLPKGTMLYSMPQHNDEPMFFILVNTKNLSSMKKYDGAESQNYLAAPISAYHEEIPCEQPSNNSLKRDPVSGSACHRAP